MELKHGDKGNHVKQLQRLFGLDDDGVFGNILEAAVKNWQTKNGLQPTGFISHDQFESLFELDITTDAMESAYVIPTQDEDIFVKRYYLPKDEYKQNPTKKLHICIHHTAGWENPYNQVDQWANDNRGAIGTNYIIGGIHPTTLDDKFDGEVLQVFTDNKWAWHLGVSGTNPKLDYSTIGIELCNFGYLNKVGNKFIAYTGKEIHPSQVVELDEPFRKYKYWHKYSDAQIFKLKYLILYLAEVHDIEIGVGLPKWLNTHSPNKAFEFNKLALDGKVGLFSHTNVRTDKFDVSPQPNLVNMLKELIKK